MHELYSIVSIVKVTISCIVYSRMHRYSLEEETRRGPASGIDTQRLSKVEACYSHKRLAHACPSYCYLDLILEKLALLKVLPIIYPVWSQ